MKYFLIFAAIAFFFLGCNEGMKPAHQTTNTLTHPLPLPWPITPQPQPQPNPNSDHVAPGPHNEERVDIIAEATLNEYPHLVQPTSTVEEKQNNTEQLLRRTIWHLQQLGYQSGRQRNPSGAISRDKLSVLLEDGRWMAYDLYTDWDVPDRITRRVFVPVGEGNYVSDPGVAD